MFELAILIVQAESFCGGPKARKPHGFHVCENLVENEVFANIEIMRLAGLGTYAERLG